MTRPAVVTGALFVLVGLAVFTSKVVRYDVPLASTDARGMWQVELRLSLRGEGRRGGVTALIPSSDAGQVIFGERSTSDRLVFSIRSREEARIGVWTGWLDGVHEVLYAFRVQSFPVEVELPSGPGEPPPEPIVEVYGHATPTFPSGAPQIDAMIERLALPGKGDPVGRATSLFGFVSHEVATVEGAGDDAVLTLAQREGSPEGKARLLVSLLRAADIPARGLRGLELKEGVAPQERVWTEAWIDGRWVPMSTVDDFFGRRPEGFVSLGDAERALFDATGVRAVGHRYFSLREHLSPEEIATVMAPANPVLAALSLYRLPVATQTVLRGLLLLPIGALIVALYRNGVGLPTYGTFMPVLIAFAIRDFSLLGGIALVAFVLGVGVLARLPLDRLRLLLVPRLSVLLCLVVLTVTGVALVGAQLGARGFLAGVLFPIVILTMLIERVSITIAEEGVAEAARKTGSSLLVAVTIWPLFGSARAEYLMFSFPELVFVVTGVLIWVGAYTGYRAADLVRFRLLARPGAGA